MTNSKVKKPTDLDLVKQEYGKALKRADSFTVTTQSEYDEGATLLKMLKDGENKAKEKKDKVLKPLLESVKQYRKMWKPLEDSLAGAVGKIKLGMAKFIKDQEANAQKKQVSIISDKRIKNTATLETRLAAVSFTPTSNTRQVLKLYIIDENLIPREYLVIDEVKLKADLKEGKVIPGAELRKDTIITA